MMFGVNFCFEWRAANDVTKKLYLIFVVKV
ncbi:hypothetical protein SDC9_83544 [bioreactor metagenome]|uniref:Uncharacterized protein n=1 Tax=bioreactor metagenome TaxID=1076179 RepID=A0A644Z7U3_9ZZZZ